MERRDPADSSDNQDLLEVMSFETPSLLGDVGFKPGDVVLSVNGQKAYSQYQLLDLLMADAGQMKTVRVARGDQEVELPFETPDVAEVAVEQVVTEDEDGLSTPASKADVQAGDVIKSAAGVRVTSTRQLVDIIQAQDNKEFQLDLLRGGKGIQVSITRKTIAWGGVETGYWAGLQARAHSLQQRTSSSVSSGADRGCA